MRDTKSPRAPEPWSVPEYRAVSEDPDCDYEEDPDEAYARIDTGNQDPEEDGYWASGDHYGGGSAQERASELPGIFGPVCTEYVSLLIP
jgi:hypothetical protein